jgi:transposase
MSHRDTLTLLLLPFVRRRSDTAVDRLLVEEYGARSHLRTVDRKTDGKIEWARRLNERRHVNVAAVALAAKHARIAWELLAKGEEYRVAAPEVAAA